jgi:hypothetical protein
MINQSCRSVVADTNVRVARVGSGAVILDLKRGKYYNLNATATMIWSALETSQNVDGIVESLESRFPFASRQLGKDVRQFVATLRSKGLCG